MAATRRASKADLQALEQRMRALSSRRSSTAAKPPDIAEADVGEVGPVPDLAAIENVSEGRVLSALQQRYANDYSRFDNIRDSDDSSDSSDDDFHLATMT